MLSFKGAIWWLGGVAGAGLVFPALGKFAEAYGEQAGWYADPQGSVHQWSDPAVMWLSWAFTQWWYTHGVLPVIFLAIGAAAGARFGARKQPPQGAEETQTSHFLADPIPKSMLRTEAALSNVLNYARTRRATQADYTAPEGEWRALEVKLLAKGFSVPEVEGKTSEAKAKCRLQYIRGLLALVREGHYPEAIAESKALVDL